MKAKQKTAQSAKTAQFAAPAQPAKTVQSAAPAQSAKTVQSAKVVPPAKTAQSAKTAPAQRPAKSEKSHNHQKVQKILAVVGGALALAALAGAGVYYTIRAEDGGGRVIIGESAEAITLAAGTNVISRAGTYRVTGDISGQIQIAATSGAVELILADVKITSDADAPILNNSTDVELTITLTGANELHLTATQDPDSAIHSKGNLVIRAEDGATLAIESTGKGIKTKNLLTIESGAFTIDSVDDAVHSNDSMNIKGGEFTLTTGDDAMHADSALTIDSGKITVLKSNEGLEANILTVNGGEIAITSSDDGLNATNSDGSSQAMRAGDAELHINGGKISVNASGDGLDSNGLMQITGGEIYVDGPADSANSALDADGEIIIEGGVVVATGSSGMAQNATTAKQPSVLINLSQSYSGTVEFGGLSFTPSKKYNSVLVSAPTLKTGTSYDLKIAGETVQSVEITNNITTIGGGMGGGMNGEMNGGMGGGRPQMDMNGESPTDDAWGRFPADGGAAPDGTTAPDGGAAPDGTTAPDGGEMPDGGGAGGFTRPGRMQQTQ